jgi:peptide/nickel transport system substrate-binding protein
MRKRSLGILVTAAMLVVAACGGGGGSSSGTVSGPPRPGGSVTFGLRADFLSLDPLVLNNDSDQSVGNGIYDPLIARVGDKGEIGPWLADSWDPSTDLRTWTLHLHPGVKFHDGTPFNADAVVFNVQRQMDPRNKSLSLADAILVDTVKAVDDRTVAITLKSPWVDFPQVLVGPVGLMASPTAVRQAGADYGKHPVGTGPFVFKEWVTGDHVTATKNKDYWKSGFPYLDSVTWRPIPDQDAKYASLKSGQIDVLQVATADQVVKAEKDSKLSVWKYAGNGGTFVMMNTRTPPFDDVNARLAISYATNRKEIVDQIGHDKYPVALGPFPPGSAWDTKVDAPNFDLAKARAALQAYGKPLSFKFNIVSDPITRQYGQILQAQWQKAGITADLVQMDQATLIQAAFGKQFQLQIFQYGDWFDPDRFLFNAFISRGSIVNYPAYASPVVDAALVRARTTSDVAGRHDAYGQVQQALAKDQPYVWLNYNTSYAISTKRVQNLNTIYSSITKPYQVWVSA